MYKYNLSLHIYGSLCLLLNLDQTLCPGCISYLLLVQETYTIYIGKRANRSHESI